MRRPRNLELALEKNRRIYLAFYIPFRRLNGNRRFLIDIIDRPEMTA